MCCVWSVVFLGVVVGGMLVVCCRGSVWSGRVMIGGANGVPCGMVVCVSWVVGQKGTM